jgi:Bacterial protein of unknown function (DUF885)
VKRLLAAGVCPIILAASPSARAAVAAPPEWVARSNANAAILLDVFARLQRLLMDEVVLSEPMARQEVERYTFLAPGQATSYFYGYTRWLQLKSQAEFALGERFDRQRYHDFLLSQGFLPPDVLAEAVMKDFVPAEQGRPRAGSPAAQGSH